MKKELLILATLSVFLLSGCKGEPVPPAEPDPEVPETPDEPQAKGIATVSDFLAFASAVNSGASTAEWENEEGWINLLADLDFTGVTDFEPVGHATAPWVSYAPEITEGHPFKGKFEGNAHHIKNLSMVCDETVEGRHYGLFGYVGPGAVVQNFVIDESCSLLVTSGVSLSAGVIAGVVYDGTVRDITSRAAMTYKGGATGLFHMALLGGLYAKDEGSIVDSVHNYGEITAENSKNLNAGATGLHVAGIVGYANAPDGNAKGNVISSCNNYGNLTSQAGRTAGIAGAANCCTQIVQCENRGNQLNTMPKPDGGRLGNICCFAQKGSSITGCKNYGNLVSTTSGRVGGIVSLPNAGEFDSNENYGEIISDSQYRGVFFGYVTQAAVWKGGKASGKVGIYNNGEYSYDVYSESGKVKYLGKDGSSGLATFTDITYDIATGEETVQPDPSLNVDADYRILFLGNSFTKDAVEHLPGILSAAGLGRIQMVHMYYGGWTIPQYVSGWSDVTEFKCYVCNPGESGWTEATGRTLAQVAVSAKWDVVTIQEHTGKLLAWGWTDTEKAAVQDLVDKVKVAQGPLGAAPKFYYILAPAYHDLSKAQNVAKPFTDSDTMWPVIAEHGRHAVTECGFDGVISTGAMLQNLRSSGYNNAMGLTRDGYHMDYGFTRYGGACTVFETIIGPQNGNVTMDGNTFRSNVSSTAEGSYTTPITDDNAPVALQAARYAIAKPYEVTDMSSYVPKESDPVSGEQVSIASAADLTAFAARVNSGDAAAVTAQVSLTADIDCASITSWTPIGYCTLPTWSATSITTYGNAFCGTFDGGNHKIKNLKLSFSPSEGAGTWGLFGTIGEGGSVKNLIFDSSCSLAISTGVSGVFGMLAGLVLDASVENVKNYAPVTGGGTSSLANNNASGRMVVGGVVGWIHAVSKEPSAKGLYNGGQIGTEASPFSRGGNNGNGANGTMVGGVIGFSSNNNNTQVQYLSDLVNDGTVYSNTGRVSGIVSSCNRYTHLKNATNNGNVYYSGSGGFRPGNITCFVAIGGELEDCVNRGDLIAPDCESTAGVVCYINGASIKITRCKSIGATIVGKNVVIDGAQTYNGVLFGRANVADTEFSGCSVSGKIGTSLDNLVTLTAANYMLYVGENYKGANPNITEANITFASE